MRHSFRSFVAAVLAVAQPLEATAQVVGPIYDFSPSGRYFRYRVDGVDVTGVNVLVRGPTEIVVTGAAASVESRVRGGTAPYTFDVASGSLPEGMTLNPSTGAATGGTTKAGRYIFAVRATDANGQAGVSLPYTIVVQNQKLEISRSPSLSAPYGAPYSDRLGATGGRQPYAWAVAQGALPPGIVLDPTTGALSGTPTALGQYLFRAQVADADGARALSTEYVLFVDDATLSIGGSAPTKAQVGASFAGRYAAAGGRGPYTYTLSGLPLPPGLGLEFDTGWIKGSPTQAGDYTGLRVRATDATARFVDTSYFSVSVVAPLAAEWEGAKAAVGTSYAAQVRRTGGRAPFAFSLVSGTLPSGLTLRPDDGGVTGVPTTAGTFGGLVVRVADADGRIVHTPSFGIEVSNGLTVVGVPTRMATRTIAYSSPTAVGGGLKPYAFRLGAGALPAGLSLDGSTGIVSGVPSASGLTEGLRILVTDGTGTTTLSDPFSIEVRDRLVVSTAGMPAYHSVDTDYAGALSASGGATPYQFAIDGTLPPGLFLDGRSGKVLGKAASAGTYGDLVATATDAEGRSATSPKFSITVSPPLAAQASSSYATVDQSFSSMVETTGGRAPLVFTSRTGLPSGLWLDPATGRISGMPTKLGTTAGIVVDVVDADGRTASTRPFDITVETPASVVATPQRTVVVRGVDTSTSAPVVTGGTAPFTYSLKGSLPATLRIDPATGTIGGTTVDVPGTVYGMLRIVATDARGRSSESDAFNLRVAAPLAISYPTTKLAFDLQNYGSQRYPATVEGGCGDVRWTMSGNLPPDIGIDENGGTVLALRTLQHWDQGSFPDLAVTARDACGVTDTVQISLDVQGDAPYAYPNGQTALFAPVGRTFATEGATTYGLSSIRFALFEGSLPEFLQLDTATGVVSGTVPASTASGTEWSYRLYATDDYGRRAYVTPITITAMAPPTVSYANGGRLPFQTTTWDRYVPTVAGGCPVSSWQLTSGSLPSGISLRSDGSIERTGGTLAAGTSGPATITLRDSCSQTASATVTLNVGAGDVAAMAPSQQGLVVGEASRTEAMTFTGFAPDVVYSLVQGSAALPSGISLDANSRFAGTLPSGTVPGTKFGPFTYRATDGFGRTAQTPAFHLTALAAPQIAYAASTSGSTGKALSLVPTVSGGATPYAYQLTGTLPAGLTFSTSSGTIQGSPTAAASASNLVVRITDASGVTKSSNAFAISVASGLQITGTPSEGKVGTAYSYTFTASGGQGARTFSTQSTLPAGLGLSSAGVLSGTPTKAGTYPLVVRVSDANGDSASLSVSVSVKEPATTGGLYAWGWADGLGNGGAADSARPLQIGTKTDWAGATGGLLFGCAWDVAGNGSCWGRNSSGQLGNGGGLNAGYPTAISGGLNWKRLAAGYATTCGITAGNELYCWGSNAKGQVGNEQTVGAYSTPQRIASGTAFEQVFAGGSVANTFCAIATGGAMSCWGDNSRSMAGNSAYSTVVPVYWPRPVAGGHTFRTAAIGDSAVCAIRTDGTIWCWGQNTKGQFASTDASSANPVPATLASGTWTSIAAGGDSFCAVRSDGRLFCWGDNPQVGALLADEKSPSPPAPAGANPTPKEVYGGGTWTSVTGALGYTAFCGTRTDGQTSCWGMNMGPVPNPVGMPSQMVSAMQSGGLLGVSLGMRNGYGIR